MDMGKYILVLSIFLVSCSNTIDFVPTDSYNEIAVWENEQSVNLYINSFYRIFNEYFIFGNKPIGGDATMSDGLTDLAKYSSNSPGEGTANLIMTQDGCKFNSDYDACKVMFDGLFDQGLHAVLQQSTHWVQELAACRMTGPCQSLTPQVCVKPYASSE